MRRLLLLSAAASALTFATTANATVTVDDTSITDVDGPATTGTTTTIGFTEAGLDAPTFEEWLTFTNTDAGLYFFTLGTSSPDVDFTSAVLTGAGGPYALNAAVTGPVEFWNRTNLWLDSGQYTLTINGENRGNGALEGSITIEQAVPEPATWAMMLFGFGAVGFAMRRRKQQKTTQRVRFAFS
jgi:hypothetical protein